MQAASNRGIDDNTVNHYPSSEVKNFFQVVGSTFVIDQDRARSSVLIERFEKFKGVVLLIIVFLIRFIPDIDEAVLRGRDDEITGLIVKGTDHVLFIYVTFILVDEFAVGDVDKPDAGVIGGHNGLRTVDELNIGDFAALGVLAHAVPASEREVVA